MIFLDVGAHEGQTLEEVTKPRYGFSSIHAYEPMPREYGILFDRYERLPNVNLHNFGLSDRDGLVRLYGDNSMMDATVYRQKRDTLRPDVTTECWMENASNVVNALPGSEQVVAKLNCEGSEIAILDSWIATGALDRIGEVLIDFDIRKVTGLEAEAERILDLLAWKGFTRFTLAQNVIRGETHQDWIAAWLDATVFRAP